VRVRRYVPYRSDDTNPKTTGPTPADSRRYHSSRKDGTFALLMLFFGQRRCSTTSALRHRTAFARRRSGV